MNNFGTRRIYYNNFAEHLLNSFNPNMTYPDKAHRWTDSDWQNMMNMIADCNFNVFEFWLAPRLFCREALESEFTYEYIRQIHVAAEAAHKRNVKVEMLCALVTTGNDWYSCCPNVPEEWETIKFLWKKYAELMDCVDIFCIFPGDPGCCARNGCTAKTYIDKSIEITHLIKSVRPDSEFDFNTWGPPVFGWGILETPAGFEGQFLQEHQASAWSFDARRCRETMEHLVRRAGDFAQPCAFSVNMGFNPDGIPRGDEDGRPWAKLLAEKADVLTWDFSLTEGENAIFPHYRFQRLFEQRRKERSVGCYSGGICYTMTPLLNSLSLYEAGRSFVDPDADYDAVAREFYERAFGSGAGELVEYLPLFEVIPDWGNHVTLDISRSEYHRKMSEFVQKLSSWKDRLNGTFKIFPDAEFHRKELEFFAEIFRDLSAEFPDYTAIVERYRKHVYAIYDTLPAHVDPRPQLAVNKLLDFFQNFSDFSAESSANNQAAPGEWTRKRD